MKKTIKWILIAVAIVSAAGAGLYAANMPLKTETVQVEPGIAELSFTEKGVCVAESVTDVYSLVSGKILSVNVTEGQNINNGDVICVVDDTDLKTQIAQAQSSMKGNMAQLGNLDTEERKQKENLTYSRENLEGQLEALEAEEHTAGVSIEERNKTRDEQIRLQNIIIAQSEQDLERAYKDLANKELLLGSGGISQNEYDEARKAADAAESILAQNRQQLEVIKSGQEGDQAAYYNGMKASLQAQIAGIDASLGKSYTSEMKRYYEALIENDRATVEQLTKRVEDCEVKAPVSGIVTTLHCDQTNVANPQTPLATITSGIHNNIEVFVSTNDIDSIQVGDGVDLILIRREGDKMITGDVKEIGEEAVMMLSALGVEERRVKVTVTPRSQTSDIKIGYDMDVRFSIYHEENKLMVPKTALFKADDQDMVWVVRDGRSRMTAVIKGIELRTDYVIESGLNAGDIVVADAAATGVKEGAKIQALQ